MGVGGRKWCDFVVYTKKGISVERFHFDPQFWVGVYSYQSYVTFMMCVAPEIVSPQHPYGLPL